MARFDIDFNGDKELAAQLAALPEVLERQVLSGAIRKALRPVLETAKTNLASITASSQESTGRLQRSLKIRVQRTRRKRSAIRIGIQTGTRAELGIPANAEYYYPAALELGTKRQPARPYLRAALNQHRASSLERLAAEVRAAIPRVIARRLRNIEKRSQR